MTTTSCDARPWPRNRRYLVNPDGTIVGPSGRPLTPHLRGDNGYPQVVIWHGDGRQRSHRVHTIVCETFHGPRPAGHEVRHLDGVPANVGANNLQWSTHVDNCADKVAHGTAQIGERNPNRRLTEFDVRAIRAAAAAGELWPAIALRHKTTRQNVGFIVRRETWRHVQ